MRHTFDYESGNLHIQLTVTDATGVKKDIGLYNGNFEISAVHVYMLRVFFMIKACKKKDTRKLIETCRCMEQVHNVILKF